MNEKSPYLNFLGKGARHGFIKDLGRSVQKNLLSEFVFFSVFIAQSLIMRTPMNIARSKLILQAPYDENTKFQDCLWAYRGGK